MGSYGPPPKRFLHFHKLKRKPGQKTDRREIREHMDQVVIGIVRFYPQWRCYIAEPKEGTIWSCECDTERGAFTKKQTELWRKSKRKKRKV